MIKQMHKNLVNGSSNVMTILENCREKANNTKSLNAFVKLTSLGEEQAKTSMKYFEEGKPRSLLEGIPVAVKDNFCIKGIETTCGSKMLEYFKPNYTATVVNELFSSGAVLLGKTNLDEFAMGSGTVHSIHGPTKNPWGKAEGDDWYIAGGSSGGSAVAVASGACFGALGSDTGGSTRNPASYCGVVGLKPTYGLVSRYGLIPLVNSMDVPGILTPTVEDAALLLDCISGFDPKDSTTSAKPKSDLRFTSTPSVKSLKIGIPSEYYCEGLSEEVLNVWKEVAQILVEGKAEVTSVSLPHTNYSIVCYSVLNQCEVASNMAKYDGIEFGYRSSCKVSAAKMFAETRAFGFNTVVKSRILAGNYFLLHRNYEEYFNKALKVRRLICNDFFNVWNKGFDILLTPTTLSDAPLFSEYMKKDEREHNATEDYFTQPVNLAGCPAISVPIKLSKKGLPLSLQLIAPNFREDVLLQVAHYIERTVQFPRQTPTLNN